ncbi:unnamed protein product [Effrenium voratum]|uniref:Uncharacterized protein n=1 Tax=Effrenium voratum TaxID=2562239 RepID=A0AA36MMJ3_9DINO|nr:unnamed protein product [Effrenium voratum]CAJ1430154.1 unnamed protein product [Effrenium voratum]
MLFHDMMGMVLLQSGLRLETPPVLRPEQVADAVYWNSGEGSSAAVWGCPASHATKNFSWWSSTYVGSNTALEGSPAYVDPAVKTLDGVFYYDAELCSEAGFLDLPNKEQLLSNYSAVMAIQEAHCGAEPLKSLAPRADGLRQPGIDHAADLFLIELLKPPAERAAVFRMEGILDAVKAEHCAANMYGCLLHFCLHSFCRQGDRIAQGNQCRSDFEILPRGARPPGLMLG